MRPWLTYSLLRVGIFAVVFAVLMLIGLEWWISAVVAAVLGFLVSYIFFRGLREKVALELAEARSGKNRTHADEDVEDLTD